MSDTDRFEKDAERVADDERDIQRGIDPKPKDGGEAEEKAMQAGARRYPEPPMPKQHQPSPARSSGSTRSPCTTRPSTRVPASWRGSRR